MEKEVMMMFFGILAAGIFFVIWSIVKVSVYAKLIKIDKKKIAFADLLLNKNKSGIYQGVAGILLIVFSFIYLIINL